MTAALRTRRPIAHTHLNTLMKTTFYTIASLVELNINAGIEPCYCMVHKWFVSPLVAVRLDVLDRGVVVQSLRHEMLRQRVFIPGGFLDFCPFVLKPDFDLRLVEAKFPGQVLPPLLSQVAVGLELSS